MSKKDFAQSTTAESYLDALQAAKFLAVPLQSVLSWAALGLIPAHCLRFKKQRAWKFRVSELATWQFLNALQLGPKGSQQLSDVTGKDVPARKRRSAGELRPRDQKAS